MDWHTIQGGVEILIPVASCCKSVDKLRPEGLIGSCADFTLPCKFVVNCIVLNLGCGSCVKCC